MIVPTLLLLASMAPIPQTQGTAASVRPAPRLSQAALTSLLRQGLGSSSTSLGINFTSSRAAPQISVVASPAPGAYQIILSDPGTGFVESVLIGLPTVPISGPQPLLVMFHAYDVSEWDCYVNGTDMFEGARARGWFVIAPLGAHQVNYGIDYSQENVEYALNLFANLLPIDQDRIYATGFSMGGGGMLSYAARHQDLNKPRFAAVTNHTGTTSVSFVYWTSASTAVLDNPLMFGGSPTLFPFEYSQASSIDIDQFSIQVDPATDQARNLAGTPVLNYHADFDPQLNIVLATQRLFSWMSLLPGVETYLLTPPYSVHHWWTMDENTALNYMGSKTLQTPTQGVHSVLADREANWFHFYIYQDAAGAFTPFRWNMEPALNRLTIDGTKNLQRIVVDTRSLGLNTSVDVEVVLATSDGLPEVLTLTGYSSRPLQVLRAGVPSLAWTWDLVAQSLTITENSPAAAAIWKITP